MRLYFNIFPLGERGAEKAKCPDQTRVRRASDTHGDCVTLEIGEGGAPQSCRGRSPLCPGPWVAELQQWGWADSKTSDGDNSKRSAP